MNLKISQPSSLLFFIIGLLCSCNGDEPIFSSNELNGETQSFVAHNNYEYFWHNNEKYYLKPDSSKFFVAFNKYDNFEKASVQEEGYYTKYQVDSNISNGDGKSLVKWQIIKGHSTSIGKDNTPKKIKYKTPFYKSARTGKTIGISNLIHIKLKDEQDIDILNRQMATYNLSLYSSNEFMPLWHTVSCNDDSYGSALEICRKLHNTKLFDIVEPDILSDLSTNSNISTKTLTTTPNDPNYHLQWNLNSNYSINWSEAVAISTGSNVSIALIDTGVDAVHPDFKTSNIHHAYDSPSMLWFANKIYGTHGMACAGIMVAQPNNGKGIAGVCPDAILHSISDPLTIRPNMTQDLAKALNLAIRTSDIVSCSWSGSDLISSEITEAITQNAPLGRKGKGTVIIFSSGNDYSSSINYPGTCSPDIIVVGATDKNGNRLDFSNYGTELDIMAPGIDIPTLGYNSAGGLGYNNNFGGTSAACPQVAGIVALVMSVNPNLTSSEISDIIEKTARKVGKNTYQVDSQHKNGSWNKYMGYGLVNAGAAVKEAQASIAK